MIVLKSSRELELMKEACVISAQALQLAGEAVKEGVTTWEIDKIAHDFEIYVRLQECLTHVLQRLRYVNLGDFTLLRLVYLSTMKLSTVSQAKSELSKAVTS